MQGDFEKRILNQLLQRLNILVESGNFEDFENFIPSSALVQLVNTVKHFVNTLDLKDVLESELELKSRENRIQLNDLQLEYQKLTKSGKLLDDEENDCRVLEGGLKDIIREALIEDTLQAKVHQEGEHKILGKLEHTRWLAETRARKWKAREEILRDKRLKLMADLKSQIKDYDEGMERRQDELDEAESELLRKGDDLLAVRAHLASVDVIYEEMRRAKKLQEILRNIARADNFRKERAATTIQRAWRALKKAKEKRRRGKRGKKRKGAGQKEGTPSSTDSMFKQILQQK